MDIVLTIIGIGILGGIGALFWQLQQKNDVSDDATKKLREDLQRSISERDEMSGKNKQLFAENTKLQARNESLEHERNGLQQKLTKYETSESQRQKEYDNAIAQATKMRESFEEEKIRIRKEDEEKIAHEQAERDRIWNEHEAAVHTLMVELCKKPETNFPFFDNTDLPKGFDSSIKPDFMVEFLGQYIIFDAKSSKSNDLKNYIRETVKKTATKVKDRKEIYSTIFFVVPTIAIGSLKQTTIHEGKYVFHIITPDALEPILSAFKRMSEYEFAEKFDPEERERFISALAVMHHHIDTRNAFDILMAQKGADLIEEQQKHDPKLAEEITRKAQKLRVSIPTKTDVQNVAGSSDIQRKKIAEMTSQKAKISGKILSEAAEIQESEMQLQ